ncbi:hypothetical protein GCM10023320_49640 [Pseudonocardia adelaidensis]|uniref:Uncharacterized protein n=1 Tax=Pseudonocardia adelaidensis TaxID=648754 RepID=A0ABP9NQZ3_9PSEU
MQSAITSIGREDANYDVDAGQGAVAPETGHVLEFDRPVPGEFRFGLGEFGLVGDPEPVSAGRRPAGRGMGSSSLAVARERAGLLGADPAVRGRLEFEADAWRPRALALWLASSGHGPRDALTGLPITRTSRWPFPWSKGFCKAI